MKKICTLLAVILFYVNGKAQYVNIPDASLANWLQQTYPGCMNGTQLDTACVAILSASSLSPTIDSDMTGLQYFKNVTYLSPSLSSGSNINNPLIQLHGQYPPKLTDFEMSNCNVQSIPNSLPGTLKRLVINNTALQYLPSLPNSITYMDVSANEFYDQNNPENSYSLSLPSAFPPNMDTLIARSNSYSNSGTLYPLPASLVYLDLDDSRVFYFPDLTQNYNLQYLDLGALTSPYNGFPLPQLPPFLITLFCQSNNLDSLPALPNTLTYLYCRDNNLTFLPTLPPNLQTLVCGADYYYGAGSGNQLTTLPALPNTLVDLELDNNQLTSLPSTAAMLNLNRLTCSNNQISSFGMFANSITELDVSYNHTSSFPAWPAAAIDIYANNNPALAFPALPNSLNTFYCYSDSAHSLPALPNSLYYLSCGGKNLDSLPVLNNLRQLICSHSNIASIPGIPSTLTDIECTYNNNLTGIPPLPAIVGTLNLSNDSNLTCLPMLTTINTLNLSGTNVSCVPNYSNVPNSTPALNTIPLCTPLNGCPLDWSLNGTVYFDANNDCIHEPAEPVLYPVKMDLYQGNNLVQQAIFPGIYSFKTSPGNYTVAVDTTDFPFRVECSGGDSTVSITGADSLLNNINFEGICGPGFDIGVDFIYCAEYGGKPGDTILIEISAGDRMKAQYGISCNTTGLSGQVQAVITGPAHYSGVAPGTPAANNISGDTITWDVADYSQLNPYFNVLVAVDTTAIIGQYFTISTIVTPTAGDINLSNNFASENVAIETSYDPNNKQVSPVGALAYPYTDWLTYTIHFQNTGKAPAQNIHITDTLDANADPSTFELLTYSAPPTVQINGRYVTFSFPAIDLPDSASNRAASTGYVQYRVKPIANLAPGSTINNQAFIYFDYNAPVATNTASNSISVATGVKNTGPGNTMSVFPNPTGGLLNILLSQPCMDCRMTLRDMTCRQLLQQPLAGKQSTLNIGSLPPGIYLLEINSGDEIQTVKVVKE